MQLALVCHERERVAKLSEQFVSTVAFDRQATAFLGTIFRERRHDHVPAGLDRVQERAPVGATIVIAREEVKHGAIMPHIHAFACKINRSDVCGEPGNRAGPVPQPRLCCSQCGGRQVKHRELRKAGIEQIVHQSRRATADVKHDAVLPNLRALNQPERTCGVRLVPADRIRSLRAVHVFPVITLRY